MSKGAEKAWSSIGSALEMKMKDKEPTFSDKNNSPHRAGRSITSVFHIHSFTGGNDGWQSALCVRLVSVFRAN